MKHNLKTFPESPFDTTPEKVVVLMQEWKRNFEKELQERMMPDEKVRELLKEADERKDWKRFAEILIAASMSSRITIKEILGEASSREGSRGG